MKIFEAFKKSTYTGLSFLAQTFGKQMIEKQWGRIINIASIWSLVTRPGRLSYATSKMALLGINKTFAIGGQNIMF